MPYANAAGTLALRQPLVHNSMQFTTRNTCCSILFRCLKIGFRYQCSLTTQRPAPHPKHLHTAITGGSRAPKGRDPGCRSKCSIASLRALTRGPDKRCLIFVIVSPLSTDCPGETIAMIKKHCWFRCPVRPLLFKRIKCIVILKRLPVPTTGAGLQCQ